MESRGIQNQDCAIQRRSKQAQEEVLRHHVSVGERIDDRHSKYAYECRVRVGKC